MSEIIFLIEDSLEGGYSARAMNYSIFTEGDSIEEIKVNIEDAVRCHFEPKELPKIIHLHFVHDEVMALA